MVVNKKGGKHVLATFVFICECFLNLLNSSLSSGQTCDGHAEG